jgi:predicted aldo/keto reductase-like oxidoreductase
MIFRHYGSTGKQVSILGFGAMRFRKIDDQDECVRMMVEAARSGVNYFDTAPKYFGTKSEEVMGAGLAELRRLKLPYFCSTKTSESEETKIRREIEAQLKRLGVDVIDFYHVWCITELAGWEERKRKGVLETFRKLKEEGLIRHICVSSHLIGDHIKTLLMENVFEGVLFGYSAYNHRTRRPAFEAVSRHKLGCVIMNPLGGGIIPQHPELFGFVKTQADETIVEGALRFLFAHEQISVVLVGFGDINEVRAAVRAVEGYRPIEQARLESMMSEVNGSFEGLCTGCQYCDDCPEGIHIPQLMEAYNQKLLSGNDKDLLDRLKWHWQLPKEEGLKCVECGQCESACTQHLDIVKRLKEMAALPARA